MYRAQEGRYLGRDLSSLRAKVRKASERTEVALSGFASRKDPRERGWRMGDLGSAEDLRGQEYESLSPAMSSVEMMFVDPSP